MSSLSPSSECTDKHVTFIKSFNISESPFWPEIGKPSLVTLHNCLKVVRAL